MPPAPASKPRAHEVVLYGATGFTGELVARYFARHVSLDRTPWAIAGRDRDKLLAVRARLADIHPGCARLPIVLADSDDRAALASLAKSAKVVLSTVGPFAAHGEALFAACVEHGTDYVDSAAEFSFVRAMRMRYHERAKARGVLLVSCCGIDCVPADLGLYFTMQQLGVRQADPVREVAVEALLDVRARPSGGTWKSLLSVMSELRAHPVRIAPPVASGGRSVTHADARVHRDRELGWVFPLPTLDPEIVLRSAAALEAYGTRFSYAHYLVAGSLARLVFLALGLGSAALLAQLGPVRALLGRMWSAGAGPSQAQRDRSWFRLHFRARQADAVFTTEVRGGDPGYDETAKMLAESALCLAVDRARLPARAGVLTPACAFGDVLLERLLRAGLAFDVVSR